MKILLTGASGYIGKNIKLELQKKHDVYEISRKKSKKNKKKYSINLEKLNENYKKTLSNLKKINLDCIIHLAYKVNKNNNSNNINLLRKNIDITYSVAEIIKYLKPKIFFNFSSTSIYKNFNGKYNEHSKLDPTFNNDFFYGLSKINSEYIFNNQLSKMNLRIVNLRIAQVLSNKMPKNRIYSIFQSQIKKSNKIEIYGNGKRTIPIIFLDDLISKINLLLYSKFNGPINLGSENISINNLAKKVIKENGNNKSKIIYVKNKDTFSNDFIVDFSLIKKLNN